MQVWNRSTTLALEAGNADEDLWWRSDASPHGESVAFLGASALFGVMGPFDRVEIAGDMLSEVDVRNLQPPGVLTLNGAAVELPR